MAYFHFYLRESMSKELMLFGKPADPSRVSEVLKYIFEKYSFLVEELHFEGQDQGNRYPDLGKDPKEAWLPLSKELHDRIKVIQGDLRFFSMADVVRAVIQMFIELMKKEGGYEAVKRRRVFYVELWNTKKESFKINHSRLSHILRKLSRVERKTREYLSLYTHQTQKPMLVAL